MGIFFNIAQISNIITSSGFKNNILKTVSINIVFGSESMKITRYERNNCRKETNYLNMM